MAFIVGEVAAPVTADPSVFNRVMREVQQKGASVTQYIGQQWEKVSKQMAGVDWSKVSKKMEDVGSSMSKYVTTPIIGAVTLSAKSAIDFESAFAGVRKTVDATAEEFAALEDGIRKMATEIPASASAISGVAEAAGQLGIETENILGFTRTMIDLGESTNLSADQAATSLARLANITQMPQSEFDRLGSTIVALGNNLATTESEIVEMGLRLAGAGKQVGMSEAQILSFAGALSSVGIEAEAGGSAFSRVMADMQLAVETGGQALTNFAAVAGMSAEEFRQAFQEDASSAIISFVEGLGSAEEQGISAIKVLDDMGITEIRLRDALLRAAGAGDLFADSLKIGTTAWEENIALTKEAEQRYQTTASRIAIMKNNVIEAAMQIGEILIPYIQEATEKVKAWVEWFRQLNPTQKDTVVALGLLAAAIGPVLTIGSKMITAIQGISAALSFLAANPIGIAVLAIGALVIAGYELYRNWDSIKEKIVVVWEVIASKAEHLSIRVQTQWNKMKKGVLGVVNDILNAAIPLLKWLPDSMVAGFTNLKVGVAKELTEVTKSLENLSDQAEANRARVILALHDVSVSFGRTQASSADLARGFRELESTTKSVGEEVQNTGDEVQNVGNEAQSTATKIGGLGDAGESAAEKIKTAWIGTTDSIKSALSLLQIMHETEMVYAEMEGDTVETLRLKHQQLKKELELQKVVVAESASELEKATKAGVKKGETVEDLAKRIDELNLRLAEEQLAQANLEKQIYDTEEAIREQGKGVRTLAEEVKKAAETYNIQMAEALEDYQSKVKKVNDELRRDTEALQQDLSSRLDDIAARGAERERQVTEQYQRELESRTRSLMNFVGLFDEVTNRQVSGETLLRNLEGQVDAFSDWQKNIQALASRGVDEGLLKELREMGPKAAPEIEALNTLTDEQLDKYVELWRERQKQAKEEAVAQLSDQREEMNRQLDEIRADTANQMEQQNQEIARKLAEMQAKAKEELEKYKIEWQKKNEEIRKNTEKNIETIHEKYNDLVGKATKYGVSMMDNFISGVESQFDRLRQTLEDMASIVDSYMPHSPAKAGPLRRLAEYGPALVKGIMDGVNRSLPKLGGVAAGLASMVAPRSLSGPLSAGGESNITTHNSNVIVNVYTWDEAERALARLGVR
jgi:TP901 family phage tail tape measure protein